MQRVSQPFGPSLSFFTLGEPKEKSQPNARRNPSELFALAALPAGADVDVEGMSEDETRTARIGRVYPDAAPDDHGDLTANGQTQTRTLLLVALELLETVEDHLLLVGRDARTGIGHREKHLAVLLVDPGAMLPSEVNFPALVSRLIRI